MNAVYELVHWGFYLYNIMIIIYILLSWVPQARETPIAHFLARLVEPYLSIFRNLIPPFGMLDISPIVALIALHFMEYGVFYILSLVISWLA
jgi:YggT family protein